MICVLNGKFFSVEDAHIDVRDRGFLLGDGIFETMLAVDGVVRHDSRHLARLFDAAAQLGLSVPVKKSEITALLRRLLHENQLGEGRAALRLTLTRGIAKRGLAPPLQTAPTLLITAAAAPPPPLHMRAMLSSYVRSEKSICSQIKTLNYLDNIMARNQAAQRGVDEALMRNGAGNVACASAANIFVVTDGVLCTPMVEDGALAGIMRSVVLDAARDMDIAVREGSVTPGALASASEIFLTNALIGVCPLIEIDGSPVGDGGIGPVTGQFQIRTSPE